MNERIRELAEQAREYATTRHLVSNITLSVNSDLFEQKFAELIVQECALQCVHNEDMDLIEKHFGVLKNERTN